MVLSALANVSRITAAEDSTLCVELESELEAELKVGLKVELELDAELNVEFESE